VRVQAKGTVLALTCAFRVPEDVLIEAPYLVALVCSEQAGEVMAVGAVDAALVGDHVHIEQTAVARGDEQAEVWRISSRQPVEAAGL
jgi:uncharacterized OB-fold protein